MSHNSAAIPATTCDAAPCEEPARGNSPEGNGFVRFPTGVTLSIVDTNGVVTVKPGLPPLNSRTKPGP